MSPPGAMAWGLVHGRNGKPRVYMSESDRTPGNRNRSQVPPLAPRASRMAYEAPGASVCRWQAAPMPDRPAPTMSTSVCSAAVGSEVEVTVLPWAAGAVGVPVRITPAHGLMQHFRRMYHVL